MSSCQFKISRPKPASEKYLKSDSVYKTVQFTTISYTVIILNNLTKLSAAKIKTVASGLASSEIQTTYKVTSQLNQLLTNSNRSDAFHFFFKFILLLASR